MNPADVSPGDAAEPQFDLVDILLFVGLGLPAFLIAFFIVAAAMKIANVQAPTGIKVLLPQFAGYLAALIPLHMIARVKHGRSFLELTRMAVPANTFASSVSLGIVTSLSIVALSVLLKTPQIRMPMEELLSDAGALIAAAVLGVTLGPWFEELIFRGLLQPLFGRYVGAAGGILLSSLLFAALHGPQYAWSWRHVLLITLAGCAFGVRRLLTNSTGAAVIMHAAYNGLLFAAYLAAKFSGAPIPKTI